MKKHHLLKVADEGFNPSNFKKTDNKVAILIAKASESYTSNASEKFQKERSLASYTAYLAINKVLC